MRLRNKKTGEIADLLEIVRLDDVTNEFYLRLSDNEGRTFKVGFNSLTELNEKWEDVPEEPKEYWYIGDSGEVWSFSDYYLGTEEETHRGIGNLFESREEAEKTVEKLKAYKRLKDKGFRFEKWTNASAGPYSPIWFYFEKDTELKDVKADLDLLFGGEE